MNDTRAEFRVGTGASKEQAYQLIGMRAGDLPLEKGVKFLARGCAGIPTVDVESSHSQPHPITLRVLFALADRAVKALLLSATRFAGPHLEGIRWTDGEAGNCRCRLDGKMWRVTWMVMAVAAIALMALVASGLISEAGPYQDAPPPTGQLHPAGWPNRD